jgi:acylphosphatase
VSKPSPKIAKKFLVRGRVQGVGYRYFTEHWATLLGIVGNVKNLWDGNVEVYAIGNAAAIAELRRQLYQGPRPALVTAIEESDEPVDGRYNRFMIEESL